MLKKIIAFSIVYALSFYFIGSFIGDALDREDIIRDKIIASYK